MENILETLESMYLNICEMSLGKDLPNKIFLGPYLLVEFENEIRAKFPHKELHPRSYLGMEIKTTNHFGYLLPNTYIGMC